MRKNRMLSAQTIAARLKTAVRNNNLTARQDSATAKSGRFAAGAAPAKLMQAAKTGA